MKSNHINRRRFIAQASCAGISSVPLFSTLLNLNLTGRVAADSPSIGKDYRALVCLYLGGGIDSFNMLAPRSGPAHDEYKASRTAVALSTEELLPIGTSQSNHPELGLHPQLPSFKALFDAGKMAFVSNVGSLVRPITLEEYKKHIAVPYSVFSHANQADQWMTCIPKSAEYGWAGRAADILRDQNIGTKVSMNISLSGNNLFQYGKKVTPYAITDAGSIALKSFDPHEKATPFETVAVNNLLEQQYKSLFGQTYVHMLHDAIGADQVFSAAVGPVVLKTVFPATQVGRDLHMVARAIGGREAIGAKRQTFFVHKGGWDTHSNVVGIQKEHLPDIDHAVAAFMSAMEELGVSNQVTLFSVSEFGRTLTFNPGGSGGGGTDHGWGGNHFIVGGAVKGGEVYGQYPSLALKTDLDAGQGRLIPTMSVDTYSAELARWFGVSDTDLTTVFPNLGNFYSASSGKPPVGFMS